MDNKNQPVYPIINKDFIRHGDESKGLTKRELCAFMALQGILANPNRGVGFDCEKDAIERAERLLLLLSNK